ncbi:hypothetical protein HELRODRAFT_182432 [Helobdella robusta]|uniref:C-type lectin domain-containing protein n=1 Tax=Helobdella robusta TaxID=6412 RepID=T1FI67_HELRO|nr:hypothetical protein HELRODRAFT_182432 [Helobdella robusta]ESN90959.1 hypothetical protein HELRODRAFT_182432 [Helobdella robusta]
MKMLSADACKLLLLVYFTSLALGFIAGWWKVKIYVRAEWASHESNNCKMRTVPILMFDPNFPGPSIYRNKYKLSRYIVARQYLEFEPILYNGQKLRTAELQDHTNEPNHLCNRKHFHVINRKTSWFEAEKLCSRIAPNGKLVSIRSQQDQNCIKAYFNSHKPDTSACQKDFWTSGRYRGNGFVWAAENSKFSFKNWRRNEPNRLAGEDCVHIWGYEDYKWNDINCDGRRFLNLGDICGWDALNQKSPNHKDVRHVEIFRARILKVKIYKIHEFVSSKNFLLLKIPKKSILKKKTYLQSTESPYSLMIVKETCKWSTVKYYNAARPSHCPL